MKCEKCQKEIESSDIFIIDGEQQVCYDCAQILAIKSKQTNKEIEIVDANYEEYLMCAWCDALYPKSELRREVNLGYICEWCVEGIHSHGEKLVIEY